MKFKMIEIPTKQKNEKEIAARIFKDQEVLNQFEFLDKELGKDKTGLNHGVSGVYEIKNRDDLRRYFKNNNFTSPSNFKNIVDIVFKNDESLKEFQSEFYKLLHNSIDEESMIDGFKYEDLTKEEEDKEWEKVGKQTDSYLESIFSFYEHGDFEDKLRVINCLRTEVSLSIFNNNGNTASRIKLLLKNTLEKEKGPSGNHYIYLHIESLLNNTEDNSYIQLLPNQFITKKYINERKEDGIIYPDKDHAEFFISKVEDFENLNVLLQERMKLRQKFKTLDYYDAEYEPTREQINKNFEQTQKYFDESIEKSNIKYDKSIKNYLDNDFDFFSNLSIRDNFNKNTSIKLEEVSIKEQCAFFDYTKNVTNEEIISFYNFLKKYNKNGFRTFLSVEQGGEEMGDKILTLGDPEKFPEDIAIKVFNKYGEIIDTADSIEDEIKKIFGNKDIPAKVLSSAEETLLKRGAKMLSDLGDKVLDPKFELNEIKILQELNEIKEETIILGQSYISLYKEGIKVPIEEVTKIKEAPVTDFNEKQKGELLKIYEKGRPKVTYERMEHLEFLKEEFKGELNDKNTSVFEICFNNETIIIALVDNKDKDTLHIGGLTFVEDVKNAVIAEASMSYVLKRFEDKNIKALVDSRNPLLNMYLKRFGFKITKKLDSPEEIKNNGGEIYYEVEKTKELKIDQKTVEKQEFDKAA